MCIRDRILSGYSQGSTFADPGYPAADGLAWKVTGPPNAFKNFIVVANKDGSCTEEAPCQGTQDWGLSNRLHRPSKPVRWIRMDVPWWWCSWQQL